MRRFFLWLALGVTVVCVLVFSLGVGILVYLSDDLPDFRTLSDYRPPLVTTVYAKDGSVIGELYKERRYLVSLNDVPELVQKAFLAAEDKAFYTHDGINFISIVRAVLVNTLHGNVRQGGSTITQQVVKALLLSPEKTYIRKLKEAILAYRIEKYLTKEEILTIYLNQIYFGEGAYGIEAAARAYFGKHTEELSVPEAAILASLPKAPNRYNPYNNPILAKQRQVYVLREMVDAGWIADAEYQEYLNAPLEYKKLVAADPAVIKASRWYVEQVRQELLGFFSQESLKKNKILLDIYGANAIYTLGLNVYTPLHVQEQVSAEVALKKGLIALSKRRGWNGPVTQLTTQEDIDNFLSRSKHEVTTQDIMNGTWIQALVEKVEPTKVLVRFGEYTGTIALQDMSWARKPNVKEVLAPSTRLKNARTILKKNDVVWVQYKNDGKNTTNITSNTVIPLILQQEPPMEGAIISVDVHTGDIIAMSGGYDFDRSQFNRALQAHRQPGSAFKTMVYSAALDKGYTPASVVLDAPIAIVDPKTQRLWAPSNYENKFFGYILLRKALAFSRNLSTIRLTQNISVRSVVERAQLMGLDGHYPPELGISLGTVETTLLKLTKAYAAFANHGLMMQPRFITHITDNTGYTLYTFPIASKQTVSPQNAYLTLYLLRGVIEEGSGRRARVLNIPLAGKTGTSNDEKDAWFIGVTPYIATGVFVGYDRAEELGKYEGGSRTALPIFVDYMENIKQLYPRKDFPVPSHIVTVQIDGNTGLLPNANTRSRIFVPFLSGTEPTRAAPVNTNSTVPGSSDILKEIF